MKKVLLSVLILFFAAMQYAHALSNITYQDFVKLPQDFKKSFMFGFISSAKNSMIWQVDPNQQKSKEETLKIIEGIEKAFGSIDWNRFQNENLEIVKDTKDEFTFFLYMLIHAQIGSKLKEQGLPYPF
jgi:hypothetical protein